MSLPIDTRQLSALRALHQAHPDLGALASAIALAFDASAIDNPQLARLILEKTCRRIVAREPDSHLALIQHLQHFGTLKCLTPEQVAQFSAEIHRLRLAD